MAKLKLSADYTSVLEGLGIQEVEYLMFVTSEELVGAGIKLIDAKRILVSGFALSV